VKQYPRRLPYLLFLVLLNISFAIIIGLNIAQTQTYAKAEPLVVPLAQDTIITNSKLPAIYATALTIIVGINDIDRSLTMSPDDLKRYTTVHISTESADITVGINYDIFFPDLTKALSVFDTSFNPEMAADTIGATLGKTLKARFYNASTEPVRVNIDSGPNTIGETASKYIEIDISQQKLFTFQNGTIVKTYRVSTGKDYPTPIGTFTILNKSGLGFSSIYNVWMPYWMGFSFSNELHAYFGIHELPYYYSGSNKIQRPRDFIGRPNTGGCVALDIGEAKEVYQFADIGTPVVIYQ